MSTPGVVVPSTALVAIRGKKGRNRNKGNGNMAHIKQRKSSDPKYLSKSFFLSW